jgi:hypothetical protein
MLGWVALVVAVVAVLDALVQLTVGVVLGVWLSLLGHTCRLEVVCYIDERYLSFYHAMCHRRVVFVVDGQWDVDRLCVVDGVCCWSGVCCTMCRRWDTYRKRLRVVTTVSSSCRFGYNNISTGLAKEEGQK